MIHACLILACSLKRLAGRSKPLFLCPLAPRPGPPTPLNTPTLQISFRKRAGNCPGPLTSFARHEIRGRSSESGGAKKLEDEGRGAGAADIRGRRYSFVRAWSTGSAHQSVATGKRFHGRKGGMEHVRKVVSSGMENGFEEWIASAGHRAFFEEYLDVEFLKLI